MFNLYGASCYTSGGKLVIKTTPINIANGSQLKAIADDFSITSDTMIVDPIKSSQRLLQVTTKTGEVVKGGRLLSRDGNWIKIMTDDGFIREFEMAGLTRAAGKTFTFTPTNGNHVASLLYKFTRGMDVVVKSDLIPIGADSNKFKVWKGASVSNEYFVVTQQFSITNNTYLNLQDVESVYVDFSSSSSNYEVVDRVSAVPMAIPRQSIEVVKSSFEDVVPTINIGGISYLESGETSLLPTINAVLLSVKERKVCINPYSDLVESYYTFEVEGIFSQDDKRDDYLFPSTANLKDNKDLTIGSVELELKKAGDTFERDMGENKNIIIAKREIDQESYTITLKSASAYRHTVVVSGYRIDDVISEIAAGATVVFKGKLKPTQKDVINM